jgi:B-cell receptor-associated protein 31
VLIACTAETLKKQSGQQAAEYDRLATQYNASTGQVSNKRKD